ncbi:aromatic amino acid lyase [Hymenobacter caeli]|uniref:Histidine ammonia-lyase n=1 Tax=Hymenobacter caeli TaxID=2735894 RepID=A0ABX2FL77_9BACT|nr:aromatic amino acid lyase [Hymenobacter caeli]NRT17707.1 histidine ammonia-lyase [Hymenobacter caeli]
MPAHLLAPDAPLTLTTLADLLASGETVALAPGVAAGFAPAGAPAPAAELDALRAGACGTGPEVPQPLVRLMLLLTAQQLVNQPAGLATSTAERLLALYNRELLPVVFEQGGDAAARAHLALPLLGEGEVNYQGYRLATADALSLFSWAPLALRAGEAAALGRGAPLALAYAVDALLRTRRLLGAVPVVRALSPDTAEDAMGPAVAALAAAEPAVEQALGAASVPLAPALGPLAEAVAALGRASAGRTGQWAAALGAGAAGLAAHSLVASQSIKAETDVYAAQRTRQLVENAEQLLGMELLAAAQAREAGPGAGSYTGLLAAFRAAVPATGPGQAPYPALRLAAAFVRSRAWEA